MEKNSSDEITEFDKLFGDEFFIIDSDNLEKINTKLYGYMIKGDEIIQNDNLPNNLVISPYGTYLLIQNKGDYIKINQDFNGSMVLYKYTNNDYFALSNSFLKLVEYLKDKKKISLNNDFAKTIAGLELCSEIYKETAINEIEAIPRAYITYIDKINKKLDFKKIDYEEKSIKINSIKGLKTLDSWFNKWVNVLRKIKTKTNDIEFKLTGGFDSRVIFTIALCANIDLNKIKIGSANDNKFNHKEDFEIATQISKEFNFKLNQGTYPIDRYYFKDPTTYLKLSFYLKLGLHNDLFYKTYKENQPKYLFGGEGGGVLRAYLNETPKEYIDKRLRFAGEIDKSFVEPTERILNSSFKKLSEDFNLDINSKELPDINYKETRSRNHFGKNILENYYLNIIHLSPFFDYNLRKLSLNTDECNDKNLLFALILTRYCPKLLNFKIEGNRKFDENTIEYAKKINNLYPYEKKELDYISGPPLDTNKINHNSSKITKECYANYIKAIFLSNSFKKEFLKYYSENAYNNILKHLKTDNYHPERRSIPTMSIIKIINDINHGYDLDDWLKIFFYKDIVNNLEKYNLLLSGEYIEKEKYNQILLENKELKRKNKELEQFKNNVLNSNSWKITKPIRSVKNKFS